MHPEDKALIDDYLQGVPEAVARVKGWVETVSRSYRARLGEDWPDVVQQVQGELFQLLGAGRFRGEARLSTYVWRVTNNMCIDWIRRQGRWQWVDVEEVVNHLGLEGDTLKPARRAEHRDLLDRVLERMSRDCIRLFAMVFEGLAYAEMSHRLGKSIGALRVQVRRCRQRAIEIRDSLR